jgi:hypothetical protein
MFDMPFEIENYNDGGHLFYEPRGENLTGVNT